MGPDYMSGERLSPSPQILRQGAKVPYSAEREAPPSESVKSCRELGSRQERWGVAP